MLGEAGGVASIVRLKRRARCAEVPGDILHLSPQSVKIVA